VGQTGTNWCVVSVGDGTRGLADLNLIALTILDIDYKNDINGTILYIRHRSFLRFFKHAYYFRNLNPSYHHTIDLLDA
jgi:hypothetical protein